jgi:hypothetical protein
LEEFFLHDKIFVKLDFADKFTSQANKFENAEETIPLTKNLAILNLL